MFWNWTNVYWDLGGAYWEWMGVHWDLMSVDWDLIPLEIEDNFSFYTKQSNLPLTVSYMMNALIQSLSSSSYM